MFKKIFCTLNFRPSFHELCNYVVDTSCHNRNFLLYMTKNFLKVSSRHLEKLSDIRKNLDRLYDFYGEIVISRLSTFPRRRDILVPTYSLVGLTIAGNESIRA